MGYTDTTILLWDLTGLAPDGQLSIRKLTPQALAQCWESLGSADGQAAHKAIWTLVAGIPESVGFLAERLQPFPVESIRALIVDLDSANFPTRQQATRTLFALGTEAEDALHNCAAQSSSPEARRRAQGILNRLAQSAVTPNQLRHLRAIEVLEHAATREARELIERLAKDGGNAILAQEARAAICRLKYR